MEHTTNYIVGLALRRLLPHHEVTPEPRPRPGDRGKKPDIDIQYGDARIVLEAKRNNKTWAARAAANRFAELNPRPVIVGALSYPKEFSARNAAEAVRAGAALEFALANSAAPDSWNNAWRTGTVYDLAQAIRNPGDMGVGVRDEVGAAVSVMKTELKNFAGHYKSTAAAARKDILNAIGAREEDTGALQRAALIVTNALMFYAALRENEVRDMNEEIYHPRDVSGKPPIEICRAWVDVRKCVNYGAILDLAEQIVRQGGVTGKMMENLQSCAQTALPLARAGVDILGRIFHEVLEDAKPMAAFYTGIPGAVMMAEIALDPDAWPRVDWAKPESAGRLRVCDPACGSGTLSSALAWKIRDNHLRAAMSQKGWEKSNGGELRELQKRLVENVMRGYDISRASVHMTATALGLISPEVDFRRSGVYVVRLGPTPWGKKQVRLGSLDYLDPKFNPLADVGRRAVGEEERAPPPEPMDLCAMNPPFVSGRKGNEIFSHVRGKDAQAKTQRAFQQLGKKFGFHPGRGLGPAFVALGAKIIKPGGKLAMILPSTLAMGGGKEWTVARQTIEDNFNLDAVIVSKDPVRPAFSDSTNLSECMAFARKLRLNEKPSAKPALFVWLHENPDLREKALAVSRRILDAAKSGEANGDLVVGGKIAGQFARMPYRGQGAWFGVNFADARLAWAANEFAARGKLSPYADGEVPMIHLGDAAAFGSHRTRSYMELETEKKRIERSSARRYAVYYPKVQQENGIPATKDNHHLVEEPKCWVMPVRGEEKWIKNYYKKAGRLIVTASFPVYTSRRFACLVTKRVQCVDYWPVTLKNETETRLKAMTLWMASSPSILMTVRTAVVTNGSWLKMGQGCLKQLPVLDLEKIGKDKVNALAACFDEFIESGAQLGQIRDIAGDGVRAELDGHVARILGLGELQPLRDALGNEPVITNRPVGKV